MPETLRWFYKSLEGMVTNLAVVSSDTPQIVRFADQEGFVFDRITFDNDLVLEDKMRRIGFKEANDDDHYVNLFRLPSKITDLYEDGKPTYSLGSIGFNLLLDFNAANMIFGNTTMKKLLNYALKALSLPFFIGAFLLWITADYPDCNAFSFGGCGIFEVGILGGLKSLSNWLIVVLVAMPGAIIWAMSDWLFPIANKEG